VADTLFAVAAAAVQLPSLHVLQTFFQACRMNCSQLAKNTKRKSIRLLGQQKQPSLSWKQLSLKQLNSIEFW